MDVTNFLMTRFLSRSTIGLAAFAGVVAHGPASACSSMASSMVLMYYNPQDVTPTTQDFDITISPNGGLPSTTPYRTYLRKPVNGAEPSGIPWDIEITGVSPAVGFTNDIDGFHSPPSLFLPAGTFTSANTNAVTGGSVIHTRVTFQPGLTMSLGNHTFYYLIDQIYDADVGCAPGVDGTEREAGLTFTVNALGTYSMNLKGGGVGGTLDFGQSMSTGDQKSAILSISSNAPFKVTMDSEHNGVMKFDNNSASTDEVSYSATLGGVPVSEGSPFQNTASNGTNQIDTDFDFTVTVGDTNTQRAGDYKDTITLTVSAL